MNSRNIFSYIIAAGLLAVLFIPFVVADSQLFPFITGKGFTFRILVEILFGIWLVGMFWDSSIRPRFSWIMGAVLIFTGVVIVADLAGMNLYKSFWSNFERMDGLITTLHLLAYFMVATSVLNTRTRWQLFLNTSVVASVIMSIYVFLQLAGKITINQGGVRVDGTFGNATYLAVYMLFNFFIATFLLLRIHAQDDGRGGRENKNEAKWYLSAWYVLALIFQVVSIYFAATRGAILGLIGGLIVAAVLISIFEKSRPVIRKIAIGGLLGLVVLIGVFFAMRNTEFVRQSPTLGRFASISIQEISSQGRRYVWPMAVQGFLEKPILGWGQENFNYVFNKNYDPRMYTLEPWFDRAHNIVLDWLVAGGALGLLSYLCLFGVMMTLIWKSKTFSVTEKSILFGLIAAYFFQNLFVFDNLISYVYFFSLLAFVHSDHVQGKAEIQWLSKLSERKFATQKILPAFVLIAVIWSVYYLNLKPISASQAIITAINSTGTSPEQGLVDFKKVFEYKTFADGEAAEQLTMAVYRLLNTNVSPDLKRQFGELGLEKMKAQTERFSGDARYLLFMGSLYSRLGTPGPALEYLEKARQVSPRKQKIIQEIGLAYIGAGDFKMAAKNLKEAYDLGPEFRESIMLYAIGALYNKDTKIAQELLTIIGEGDLIMDERIIAAYADTNNLAEAVRLLQKRVTLYPNDPTTRFRLAAGYLSLGQRTKAVEILREAGTLFPAYKDQAEFYIKEIQAGRNP